MPDIYISADGDAAVDLQKYTETYEQRIKNIESERDALRDQVKDLIQERNQALDSLRARDSLVIASKEKAERENDVLLNALIKIRDSRFCDYENTGQTSYGTGVTDGHRFCSNVARIAIDAMQEEQTDA